MRRAQADLRAGRPFSAAEPDDGRDVARETRADPAPRGTAVGAVSAVAALNQPIATAAAPPFVRVLAQMFGGTSRDAAIAVPRVRSMPSTQSRRPSGWRRAAARSMRTRSRGSSARGIGSATWRGERGLSRRPRSSAPYPGTVWRVCWIPSRPRWWISLRAPRRWDRRLS